MTVRAVMFDGVLITAMAAIIVVSLAIAGII